MTSTIQMTEDIPASVREDCIRSIGNVIPVADSSTKSLRSAEPPSWIQFLADLLSWSTVIKVPATVFLAELAKEAAKDTWKNKERIAKALKQQGVEPLLKLSRALFKYCRASPRKTSVIIGFPFPDEDFGTGIAVEPETEE